MRMEAAEDVIVIGNGDGVFGHSTGASKTPRYGIAANQGLKLPCGSVDGESSSKGSIDRYGSLVLWPSWSRGKLWRRKELVAMPDHPQLKCVQLCEARWRESDEREQHTQSNRKPVRVGTEEPLTAALQKSAFSVHNPLSVPSIATERLVLHPRITLLNLMLYCITVPLPPCAACASNRVDRPACDACTSDCLSGRLALWRSP